MTSSPCLPRSQHITSLSPAVSYEEFWEGQFSVDHCRIATEMWWVPSNGKEVGDLVTLKFRDNNN